MKNISLRIFHLIQYQILRTSIIYKNYMADSKEITEH